MIFGTYKLHKATSEKLLTRAPIVAKWADRFTWCC